MLFCMILFIIHYVPIFFVFLFFDYSAMLFDSKNKLMSMLNTPGFLTSGNWFFCLDLATYFQILSLIILMSLIILFLYFKNFICVSYFQSDWRPILGLLFILFFFFPKLVQYVHILIYLQNSYS